MKNLRKKIEKDWGKKCKEFVATCSVCEIHRALEVIEALYDYAGGKKYKKCNH